MGIWLEHWKNLVGVLRDSVLLLLGVLLVAFPSTFNDILVAAGFDEGSVVGFKWKAKLIDSDMALKESQANISQLAAQNEKLAQALADAQSRLADRASQEKLAALQLENRRLQVTTSKVEANVMATINSNAALVEKAQLATGSGQSWGVVYGGDTTLEAARYETRDIAGKYQLTNTAIYYRQGAYRSVAIAADPREAEQLLFKAKSRRADAYIVNMQKWCPRAESKPGYWLCQTA